ncbi:MAG: pyruvate ferredoxin oxidoreductase [Chloroflexi bacterium]|nr:pyruvate ferredoxin oxidoreductase [Chloroflexota bacterium]
MKFNLREISQQEELLAPGHRLCSGCIEPVIVRQVLQVAGPNTVVANATSCLEVSSTAYPYTAWRVPWIHSLFENTAATISGVEAAYKALSRRGRLNGDGPINFIAFGGDGGTYDIGLQALSGAIERGHRFLYVCLNNEAYMNTGIQRSSASPFGAWTTTSPVGSVVTGKQQARKDLTRIIAAHGTPYVAQASPHLWKDLMRKTERALQIDGPAFINVLAPCPRGWRSPDELGIQLGKLAAETCVWPIYEVDHGQWTLNHIPRQRKPITEWLKVQGRFGHLLRPENRRVLEQYQAEVDTTWDALLAACGKSGPAAGKDGRAQQEPEESGPEG